MHMKTPDLRHAVDPTPRATLPVPAQHREPFYWLKETRVMPYGIDFAFQVIGLCINVTIEPPASWVLLAAIALREYLIWRFGTIWCFL